MNLTKDDYDEWRHDPRTQAVFKMWRAHVADWKEALLSGSTILETAEKTAISTAQLVSKIEGMEAVMTAPWSDLSGEEEQADDEGTGESHSGET